MESVSKKENIMDKEFNGWTNRETWAVALWLGNDTQSIDEASRAEAARIVDDAQHPDVFREWVEGYALDVFGPGAAAPASLATELILGALSRVNWRELVDALTTETTEERKDR